ncbi:hypothetical protein AG1IA_04543 [Rhizoctonia solani AG-1 IA]|uniref:Uncharacterized protein n=1 Tax=Thanatephorus cucumeris (strain AG1-IA) TaxID=983506 RepID=L8WTV3_THACA|nr:hypothetical protein AG1IA_04543 [Rhizoctonia solani AG-1 IA]
MTCYVSVRWGSHVWGHRECYLVGICREYPWQEKMFQVTYVLMPLCHVSAAPAIIAEAGKRGIGETPVEVEVDLGGAVSGGGKRAMVMEMHVMDERNVICCACFRSRGA